MDYKTTGSEPTIQNGGLARGDLQLPDLQTLANGLVPNLVDMTENTPTRTRKPGRMAGLFRVYGIVNNYRTNYDDFRKVYLLGVQLDTE